MIGIKRQKQTKTPELKRVGDEVDGGKKNESAKSNGRKYNWWAVTVRPRHQHVLECYEEQFHTKYVCCCFKSFDAADSVFCDYSKSTY